jgi:hypothetical protein
MAWPLHKQRQVQTHWWTHNMPALPLQELRAKVYAELEATPDKGRQFAAAVRHLMKVRRR